MKTMKYYPFFAISRGIDPILKLFIFFLALKESNIWLGSFILPHHPKQKRAVKYKKNYQDTRYNT